MAYRIFIDGQEGTTGLQIRQRLSASNEIELMVLPENKRKDKAARHDFLNQADLAVLCLPDEVAREAVHMIESDTKILDTSTAHRTDSDWIYGMPELNPTQAAKIAAASRVTNPGCYAIGALALLAPLTAANLLPHDIGIAIYGISGYSGGGKAMIADYTQNQKPMLEAYALTHPHKHMPEIHHHSQLRTAPTLHPFVGNFPQGMLISITFHQIAAEDIRHAFKNAYQSHAMITLQTDQPDRLDAVSHAGRDDMLIYLFDQENSVQAVALFDNLGKGAAGTAMQNIQHMLSLKQKQVA